MSQTARGGSVASIGFESRRIANRTGPVGGSNSCAIRPDVLEDSSRQERQIELIVASPARDQNRRIEPIRIALRERVPHGLIDLVAATTGRRADRRYPGAGSGDFAKRRETGLDDARGQSTPARMDRGNPRSVDRSHQNRDAIRRHDPDTGRVRHRYDRVRCRRIACDPGARESRLETVDLARKPSGIRDF